MRHESLRMSRNAPVSARPPLINVIIADHQPVFRAGIAKLLATEDDMRIIAQPLSPDHLLNAVERLRPHVLILSSGFLPRSGSNAQDHRHCRRAAGCHPGTYGKRREHSAIHSLGSTGRFLSLDQRRDVDRGGTPALPRRPVSADARGGRDFCRPGRRARYLQVVFARVEDHFGGSSGLPELGDRHADGHHGSFAEEDDPNNFR